jgi:leader peptidase (prepilin peptidase)/N-methyltransferase
MAVGLAILGALFGFVADRVAARWPVQEDGRVRPLDWRTPIVVLVGAGGLAALAGRFDDPFQLALFGGYFLALTLLLATDLDQRLLPDVVTLPLIPAVLVVDLVGLNPLLAGGLSFGLLGALVAAAAFPLALALLAIPFGAGAIGMGDLKLLVSFGLLAGLGRAFTGVVSGAILSAVVIVVLLALRRITLKSYIPFGPFLILGAMWGVLAPN